MHPSIAPLGTYKSQFASEHQFHHSQMPLSGTTPCMNDHKIDPIYHERSRILNWLLIIYDNPSRSAVSKRILPPIPLLHHPLCILNHPQSIGPSKNVGLSSRVSPLCYPAGSRRARPGCRPSPALCLNWPRPGPDTSLPSLEPEQPRWARHPHRSGGEKKGAQNSLSPCASPSSPD